MYICGMSKEEEKKARAATRKPQLNLEVEEGDKELFGKVAKSRGVSVAALIRLLVFDEARRLGIS
jgi:hypothetical protein